MGSIQNPSIFHKSIFSLCFSHMRLRTITAGITLDRDAEESVRRIKEAAAFLEKAKTYFTPHIEVQPSTSTTSQNKRPSLLCPVASWPRFKP